MNKMEPGGGRFLFSVQTIIDPGANPIPIQIPSARVD